MGKKARTKSTKAENTEQQEVTLGLIYDGFRNLPAEPMEKFERILGDQHVASGSGSQFADGGSH